MPKVGQMTDRERRGRDLKALIMFECKRTRIKNLTGLAEALGVSYGTLYSRLDNGTVSALMVGDIIKVLGCTNETVLKMMGR